MRTAADFHQICITELNHDLINTHAQPFRGDLCEAGFMTLAAGLCADDDVNNSGWIDCDRRAFQK